MYLKIWAKLTLLERNADFQLIFACSASAVTPAAGALRLRWKNACLLHGSGHRQRTEIWCWADWKRDHYVIRWDWVRLLIWTELSWNICSTVIVYCRVFWLNSLIWWWMLAMFDGALVFPTQYRSWKIVFIVNLSQWTTSVLKYLNTASGIVLWISFISCDNQFGFKKHHSCIHAIY